MRWPNSACMHMLSPIGKNTCNLPRHILKLSMRRFSLDSPKKKTVSEPELHRETKRRKTKTNTQPRPHNATTPPVSGVRSKGYAQPRQCQDIRVPSGVGEGHDDTETHHRAPSPRTTSPHVRAPDVIARHTTVEDTLPIPPGSSVPEERASREHAVSHPRQHDTKLRTGLDA